MRGELYMIKRDGSRIRVETETQHLKRKVVRLQKANEDKTTTARLCFIVMVLAIIALVGMTFKCLMQADAYEREISEMADEHYQQVSYLSEEYRDLLNKYHELEKENLRQQDLIQKYEEVLPFVGGSLDYYNPSVPLAASLQAATWKIGSMYGIDPAILYGIMRKESGFNENAISGDGHDYGICQIRDGNHAWLRNELGQLDFMNPEDNITAAAYMLADIRDTYGYEDWNQILVVYNMGPGNAKDYFASGKTSSPYSKLVLQYAEEYGYTV